LVLTSSYFFYGWWSWKFLILLAASTLLDYFYGFRVASPDRKQAKIFLWLSVINNLGILAIFKYYNFFTEQLHLALDSVNIHFNPVFINVALPVGISFYTFHGLSYVFDIYRGNQKPVVNFIDSAVFVSFFPLLVAGPIERAHHLLPQVQNRRVFSYRHAVEGCRLIIWGLFKKIVIADSIAPIVDIAFENPSSYSSLSLVLGAVGFSFQIYADFSGYSDIASGVARLFGFELLKNFNLPYFSKSIPEFWKKWHISLSSWFRDYVYIPLGGSREGMPKAVRNVFIVFIFSAFWHGANWTYLVWGVIHAFFFIPGFIREKYYPAVVDYAKSGWYSDAFKTVSTFIIVTIAWIFFRAKDVNSAFEYLNSFSLKFTPDIISTGTHLAMCIKFLLGLALLIWVEAKYLGDNKIIPRWVILGTVFIIVFFGSYRNSVQFIYFQF
jgi:D-alanyl-lipoteichoic acid acyltransferase DltB (MBOAT superfamily)